MSGLKGSDFFPSKTEYHSIPPVNVSAIQRPLNGIVAAAELPENGYVSLKVKCATCTRRYGAFETITPDHPTVRSALNGDVLGAAAREFLRWEGFRVFESGAVQCPECRLDAFTTPQPSLLCALDELIAVQSTPWYTETTARLEYDLQCVVHAEILNGVESPEEFLV